MKKILLIITTLAMLTACNYSSIAFSNIEGDGNIITKKVNSIKNISRLDVSGAFNITVNIADSTSISVTTDKNLMKYIGLKISGEKLKIYAKENIRPTKDIEIIITTPHLVFADISGANDLTINGLNEEILTLDCSGASSVKVNGKVNILNADVSGSTELKSTKLLADIVNLEVSGASEAKVYAKKTLNISASGASDVSYLGNPATVNLDVSGVSSVNKIKDF